MMSITNNESKYNQRYNNDIYMALAHAVNQYYVINDNDRAYLNFMVRIQDYAMFICGDSDDLPTFNYFEQSIMKTEKPLFDKFFMLFV